MSWGLLTNQWRLKLLAVGLAALMLVAVAFSQSRPTTRAIIVGINYALGSNIVLINPPNRIPVTYTGLADQVGRVDTSNMVATADATQVKPGSAVRLNVTARSTVQGVSVQNPPPIAVNVDQLTAVDLPVQVNARSASGWTIDPSKTTVKCPGAMSPDPCRVHFVGPSAWASNLRAVAILQGNAIGKEDSLNQPIQLQNANGVLDLSIPTVPVATFDVTSANIHTEAIQGTTSATVALLDSPPSNSPPAGYRVTAVSITPQFVTISGDAGTLLRVRNITLPAVDLSGSTSDVTFQISIPYPNGVSGAVDKVTVKYSISRNPNTGSGS